MRADPRDARSLQRDLARARRSRRRPTAWTSCSRRWASCRTGSTRRTRGASTATSTRRWTRCGCRRATPTPRRCRAASAGASRSAGSCSRHPTCCCSTSRRTTSTPSRSRGSSASSASTAAPSSQSPMTATSSTTSRAGSSSSTAAAGIPFEGNYSSWLEQKQARLAVEEKHESARQRTLQRELEWIRMTPKARHQRTKDRLGAYERLLAEDKQTKLDRVEIHIPAGKRLGDVVVEARSVNKGYGDRLLIEDLAFSLPPGGIVGVIGPNGAGKTTLFRMIAGQEEPDSRRARARRDGRARLRRPEPGRSRGLEHRLEGDLRRPRSDHGRQARGAEPRLRGVVQLPRLGPAEEGRQTSRAASETACTWPSCCARAATCCCSTSRRTTSTSTRCARSRRRSSTSPAARS